MINSSHFIFIKISDFSRNQAQAPAINSGTALDWECLLGKQLALKGSWQE